MLAGGPCLISDARLSYPALVAGDLNAGLHMTGWSAAGLTNGRAADFAQRYNQPIQVNMRLWTSCIGLGTYLHSVMPAAFASLNAKIWQFCSVEAVYYSYLSPTQISARPFCMHTSCNILPHENQVQRVVK